MIKAAIFDLDGTLLNRDESIRMFINRQYDRLNPILSHIPKNEYVKRFIELDEHGYVWKDKVYQQLVKDFEIIGITWDKLLLDYLCEFDKSCVAFPNLFRMLSELKKRNLVLGIITNGKGQFQMDNIYTLGIEKFFETILISEWEGIKKPNPEIFMRALKQLAVSPKQSIFIGDHPENDVKAAQYIGMYGVWKKTFQWENTEADFTINDLAELPLIIDKLNKRS